MTSHKNFRLPLLILWFLFLFQSCQQPKDNYSADVIIYGGTAAAIITAVQIKKLGKTVLVISPDQHLGGLSAGGLGWTDSGNKEVIGGLSRVFYQRIYQKYQDPANWKWQKKEDYGNVGQGTPAIDGANRTMWIFEPHIAEEVFEDFVKEYDIPVIRQAYLDREAGVEKEGTIIQSIKTLDGEIYTGRIFIDATYEGDLMATADISYHVGREANSTYNETWNGVQVGVLHHGHHFGDLQISPYIIPDDPESGLLARISAADPGKKGSADNKVQAYCFRTCLTKIPENRVPFEKPANYNPKEYELLARVFDTGWRETFHKFDPIPNAKTDVNNHGPYSFDNIGQNYDYPEASYERREEIIKAHESYQKGLLYFLTNDEKVPEEVRKEMQLWGLSKDEFKDNGHWPHQIYVREARRMIGNFVMTENEVLGKAPINESIGMGSYTMDSHNTQRYITPEGYVQNEGDIGVHPENPYQIALGSILPKKEEGSNLIVPVAMSSSHIAFGSIRMEPVFMILGHSAATVANLAIDRKEAIQDVPYEIIRTQLLADGQVLSYP